VELIYIEARHSFMNAFSKVRQGSYSLPMAWMNLLWGMCGALAMDGLDISNHIRNPANRHRFPWRDKETNEPLWRTEFIVMVVINASVGATVAAGMGLTDPHGISPWVAIGLGAGAMTTLQKAAGHIPLVGPTTEPSASTPSSPASDSAEHDADKHPSTEQGRQVNHVRPASREIDGDDGVYVQHPQLSTRLEAEGD
jgi:hypothetical protein